MKKTKLFVWIIAGLFVLSIVGVVWAQVKTMATVVKTAGDRNVIVKTEKGEEVNLKLSGSRSKIKIGNKTGGRDDLLGELKPGMKVEVTYEPGGDNEPSLIEAK